MNIDGSLVHEYQHTTVLPLFGAEVGGPVHSKHEVEKIRNDWLGPLFQT